jgi:hypothetical protein
MCFCAPREVKVAPDEANLVTRQPDNVSQKACFGATFS